MANTDHPTITTTQATPAAGWSTLSHRQMMSPTALTSSTTPEHGERTEQPVLDVQRRPRPQADPRQDAFFCSPADSALALASASARFDSSLAAVAYLSTYSWPESRMISYMISSVIERRM